MRVILLLCCCCCIVRCIPPPPNDASWGAFPKRSIRPAAVSGSYENEVCPDVDIRNSVSAFDKLQNCSVVEGSVQILLIDNAQPKDFENMSFPKLKEITGYLLLYRVQGLQSLSKIFPNLAVIRGDVLFHNYAVVMYELRAMLDIGLINLTTILRGSVRIEKNPHLCYVETVDWDRIAKAGGGGHFIKDNKAFEQCYEQCPDTDCPQSSHFKYHSHQKLCWNSQSCQKVCHVDCELQNLTCPRSLTSDFKCCHQECLGGCSGKSPMHCVACRHVVYKKRCMNSCPRGTYKYLDHRCIEEEECINTAQNWKLFKNECLPQCPSGFTESETNRHECKACEGRCPKMCDGAVIDSVSSAQKLRGCTFVNGSLEIQIQGGVNIMKELELNLGSIKEILGYLKIARTYPLVSLNFLKDLNYIHGEDLDKKEYALLVLDNQNLQELWNWESRKEKLHILGGKVFFHFNSKLCLRKIEDLRKYADVMNWDERDVSPNSNGDRIACKVYTMKMNIHRTGSTLVILTWKNFRKINPDMDFRSLLGYEVYYKEAPTRNVTIFDGRDVCGNEWKVDDVDANDDEDYVIALLPHLKPFTTYATYMQTYMITSAAAGAQTPIIYFTTKPDTPSSPVNVQAFATKDGEIIVKWEHPKSPNGEITHYIVEGIRGKDSSEFMSQRNYCSEPLVLSDVSSSRNRTESEKPTPAPEKQAGEDERECCSCANSKNLPMHGEEAESQILFEDFLHNKVYLKNPNAGDILSKKNISSVPTTASIRSSGVTHPYMNATVKPQLISFPMKSSLTDLTEPTTTLPPETDDNRFQHKVEATHLIVKDLHHFTEYTIEVRACQNSSQGIEKPCSQQSITTVRTLPKGGADDIDFSSISINYENLTSGVIFLKWDEPKDYNGLIVNYHIEIKSSTETDYKAPYCITQLEYQKKVEHRYVLLPGNYSLRIRATSLAGNGNWTNSIYFVVPDPKARNEKIIFIVIGIVLLVCFMFGGAFYALYKKKYAQTVPTMLYASVNPEYMSLIYEPDEWEVAREKVTVEEELGQGSFGMVYKGKFESEANGVIECAVKTVNATASLRETIEFLQEASVMKAFNCHHVVKLLGVVSKGQPTLVIMELMGKGDLKGYLRAQRPDSEENLQKTIQTLPPTLREILQMAIEIADGMAYLAAKKFVHRDLAARNCMVSEDLTVKIGDFGMTRDIYETDYYRKGGKGLLPVRWMAPECLKDGLFSSQSDVWSYGVVLWEMATLASQPYQGLANEQVLHYVISGGKMTKPENCPEKLYALMELCWAKNPKARPTFIELIDMLLRDIDRDKFIGVSFYVTQRHSDSAPEPDAYTPMRTPREGDSDHEEDTEMIFFPPTRYMDYYPDEHPEDIPSGSAPSQYASSLEHNGRHRRKNCNPHPPDVSFPEEPQASGGARVNEVNSSDDSKASNTSNGDVMNGRIPFVPCRTTAC